MKPALHHVGERQTPVVVVDDFTGAPDDAVELAASLAPFPPDRQSYYPGLRQSIDPGGRGWPFVQKLLEAAAPFIGGGFDANGFKLLDASFSMITAAPATLLPPQRGPHFDSTDPDYLAILLYLSDTPGTAFFRQKATGIEVVTEDNFRDYVATCERVNHTLSGYVEGSNAHYERIGHVDGARDRLTIYPGSLLHSGIIPAGTTFSGDPREGRLTANLFIRVSRS